MPRPDNSPLPQPVFSEPAFGVDGSITTDPDSFTTPHPSDEALYQQIQELLTKDVVAFDKMRGEPSDIFSLSTVFGSQGDQLIQGIKKQEKISFHVAGDSGASSEKKYQGEINVADALTNDIRANVSGSGPAFLYHVGDIVYDFGELQYWYDQFYEPFRGYGAPIFAIPGNHDSFIVPNTPPDQAPLSIFASNFCATEPVITQEAGSLHRTAMTQPGVYFTLDAPFVRIIGLFSNSLEDPGVISSEGGKWPNVPDFQLEYLAAQLKRIKDENYQGAILIASHHPPFAYSTNSDAAGGHHSSSSAMLQQIDEICADTGVFPHAYLSGHSHNYQRFTRTIAVNDKNISIPYFIVGNSGHNVNPIVQGTRGVPAQKPNFGGDASYLDISTAVTRVGLTIDEYDDQFFGYLTVTADAGKIVFNYNQVQGNGAAQFTPATVNIAR